MAVSEHAQIYALERGISGLPDIGLKYQSRTADTIQTFKTDLSRDFTSLWLCKSVGGSKVRNVRGSDGGGSGDESRS